VAVAFDCARGMQNGEQLDWGVLGETVHHHGALADSVAAMKWQ